VRPITDLQRSVAPFRVITDMTPAGDQPAAIAEITKRIQAQDRDTVLLGATGTGKTASVAWIAEKLQRPVLVMLPNKTLAAQFANELREMLPRNATTIVSRRVSSELVEECRSRSTSWLSEESFSM